MEKIKLGNGNEYQIALNGLSFTDTNLRLTLVDSDTLNQILSAFETLENVQTIEVVDDAGEKINSDLTGYTILTNLALQKNYPNGDDTVVDVVIVSLKKEDLQDRVNKLEELVQQLLTK